jgi:hypothetical protein
VHSLLSWLSHATEHKQSRQWGPRHRNYTGRGGGVPCIKRVLRSEPPRKSPTQLPDMMGT